MPYNPVVKSTTSIVTTTSNRLEITWAEIRKMLQAAGHNIPADANIHYCATGMEFTWRIVE